MFSKNMIIAIVAVAVVAIAAVAIVATSGGGGSSDGKIKIVDGAGKEIVLDEPLDKVVVGNTNIPKMCVILGAEDLVTGLSFYSSSSDASNWEKYGKMFPNAKHMSIEPSMTAEEVYKVAKAVIVPVESMTISYAQELAYKQMGITVIRLNCNGDTAQEDMEKLTVLFGETKKIMDNYEEYWTMYNEVKDTVLDKVKASELVEYRFLNYFSTGNAFYNQTAALSEIIESMSGKNALREIPGLDLSRVSNDADTLGMKEAVLKLDAGNPIDVMFIRGSASTTTETAAVKVFKGSVIFDSYKELNSVKNNDVYMFASDPMSGCLSYVAYVMIAEILEVDTGYDVAKLVSDYNERYGFSENTEGLAFQIIVDGTDVSATQIF